VIKKHVKEFQEERDDHDSSNMKLFIISKSDGYELKTRPLRSVKEGEREGETS
jgi:hypothetical protein